MVRELVFRFGIALLDPGLPEARDSVPIIGIQRLFRSRQQLFAKSFLHRAILPRAVGQAAAVEYGAFQIRQCRTVDVPWHQPCPFSAFDTKTTPALT
jgi:hypothetical protein